MRCPSPVSVLAFALLLLTAGGAAAQSDVFCICTDAASGTCGGNLEVDVPGSCTIHFVLAQPSGSPVMAWEARVTVEGSATYVGGWTLTAGLNVGSGDDYTVGLQLGGLNGLSPNSVGLVPLMSMTVMLLGEGPLLFKVGPVPGSASFPDGTPGYLVGVNTMKPATVCSGDFDRPVFTLNNGDADQQGTWGEVKTLYSH
ncbi:MAG: hypothetical protein IPM94_16605 [bacterium]|nr:hypothetical protein [bacterium]